MSEKGKVEIQATATCGLCENQFTFTFRENQYRKGPTLRREGWTFTRKFGWLCPACSTFVEAAKR